MPLTFQATMDNRYLELADIALGKVKRKSRNGGNLGIDCSPLWARCYMLDASWTFCVSA